MPSFFSNRIPFRLSIKTAASISLKFSRSIEGPSSMPRMQRVVEKPSQSALLLPIECN